jgi:hypothetical protein
MIPKELTEKFHPSLVKKNQKNQDYVSIDGYINRLNEVLGARWAWNINSWKCEPITAQTSTGKPQYLATVQGTLTVMLEDIGVISIDDEGDGPYLTTQSARVSRDGIGADIKFDPDGAVKTAQAEALKKACHQFGIALYLWSEDERDYVDLQRKASKDDVQLKHLVMEYTIRDLGLDPDEQPQREDIIKCLGTEDLSVENMRKVLTERGVI